MKTMEKIKIRSAAFFAFACICSLAVSAPQSASAETQADYTQLEAAVADAEEYLADAEAYSDASVWKLQYMLDKVVYGRPDSEQGRVDSDVSDILAAIGELKEKRNGKKEFDEDDVVLRFGAMSDIHLWVNDGDEKFSAALEMLNEQAGDEKLDLILFGGDLTDKVHASRDKQEIEEFKSVLEQKADVSETAILYTLGNHDVFSSGTGGASVTSYIQLFSDVFGEGTDFSNDYFSHDVGKEEIPYGRRHVVVGGYHFLSVQIEKGYITSEESLAWLDKELAEITAENPEQYVFVTSHCGAADTIYGTDSRYSADKNNIDDVLKKYPQTVLMTGHFHNDVNLTTSVMQTEFTAIELGSVNYFSGSLYYDGKTANAGGDVKDVKDYSQLSYIEVDGEGNFRLYRLDAFNHQVLDVVDFQAPDEEGYFLEDYTRYRYYGNETLHFDETAEIAFYKTTARNGILSFSRASGDALLCYDVVCNDKQTGETLYSAAWSTNLFYYGKGHLPEKVSGTVRGLVFKEGSVYEFVVTPYDEWGREGETIVFDYTFTGCTDASDAIVTLSKDSFQWEDGMVYTPSVTVTFAGETLTENLDYLVSYTDNDKAGKATVTVTLVNLYSGTIKKTFDIVDSESPVEDFPDSSSADPPAGTENSGDGLSESGGCGSFADSGVVSALCAGTACAIALKKRK